MNGKLILVVGSSGSGKGVLMQHLKHMRPDLVFPVSYTTRAPRAHEKDGEVYHFVSSEVFVEKKDQGEFLEWAAYGGNSYATPRAEIISNLERGKTLVREMDVQGAKQLRTSIPLSNLRVVFVDAGSWESLEARIRARACISVEELQKRRERFKEEEQYKTQAFRVVKNYDGELEQAKNDFVQAVEEAAAK